MRAGQLTLSGHTTEQTAQTLYDPATDGQCSGATVYNTSESETVFVQEVNLHGVSQWAPVEPGGVLPLVAAPRNLSVIRIYGPNDVIVNFAKNIL